MIMVPQDWEAFIKNTILQVEKGDIPMTRVNDAVTRILRVKMRAGIFDAKRPVLRLNAGIAEQLQQRDLAREAVRKSLVLLKNDNKVLPLKRGEKILVVGKSANSIPNQTGGWSLTWQGTDNKNTDFPNADSILAGIQDAAGASNVDNPGTTSGIDFTQYKAVIAVIGETPYAEGNGDIDGTTGTLEHARRTPDDLAVLNAVSNKGVPVITVFVTGRPLMVNQELNRSDAFVVAWLPGTEGKGIADVLFRDAQGAVNFPVTGKLSFSWPKSACPTALNKGEQGYDPLFAYGFGLTYDDDKTWTKLDETTRAYGCGETATTGDKATTNLELFNQTEKDPYALFIGSAEGGQWNVPIGTALTKALMAIKVETADVTVQGDAKKVTWTGQKSTSQYDDGTGQFYVQPNDLKSRNLGSYAAADVALMFDTIVYESPSGKVEMRLDSGYPDIASMDVSALFKNLGKRSVKLPLKCFVVVPDSDTTKNFSFKELLTPFLISTNQPFVASFANIRWVPNVANDADAVKCDGSTITTDKATTDLEIFKQTENATYLLALGSPEGGKYAKWYDPIGTDLSKGHASIKVETTQIDAANDAKKVTWTGVEDVAAKGQGSTGQFYAQSKAQIDRQSYLNADSALVFDTIVHQKPTGVVTLRINSTYPDIATVVATAVFTNLATETKSTVTIPLSCFVAEKTFSFTRMQTPFLVDTDKPFIASFGNVRWVAGAGKDVKCPS